MGDTAATPKADAPETEATPPPASDAAQQPTKTEVPPEVVAALKKANKEAETLRHKLKEIEDRDKSESQRNAEDAAAARKELAGSQTEVLRLRVAIAKKLPAQLADRLRGETEEEMTADADALLKAFGPKNGTADWEPGHRTPAPPAEDMNARIRQAAGRA